MGGCRGEGAAPPPAMRTKKEVHRRKSWWISIKIKWIQINNDDACEKKRMVGSKGSRLKNKSGWGGQEKETFLSFFKRRLLLSFFSFPDFVFFFDPWVLPLFRDSFLVFSHVFWILFFLIPICFFWSLFVFFWSLFVFFWSLSLILKWQGALSAHTAATVAFQSQDAEGVKAKISSCGFGAFWYPRITRKITYGEVTGKPINHAVLTGFSSWSIGLWRVMSIRLKYSDTNVQRFALRPDRVCIY